MHLTRLRPTALAIACCLTIFFLSSPVSAVGQETPHQVYLERANAYIKAYRHFPATDALKQAAKLSGDKHPSIYMRLAILYYGLGFIPEAIAAAEQAVALAPDLKWYKFDLGKFYFVNRDYDKAKEQLMALLKLDPAFTQGYYYLGETYYQKGQYSMAWLCLDRAEQLGHEGNLLKDKLVAVAAKPEDDFVPYSQDTNTYFRFIKFAKEKDAIAVLKQIEQGKMFENLELELQNDKTIKASFGIITTAELDANIARSLHNFQPYAKPLIMKTGPEYRLMQRILPFEPASWEKLASTAETAKPMVARKAPAETPVLAALPAESPAPPEAAKMAKMATPQPALAPPEPPSSPAASEETARSVIAQSVEKWRQAWENADTAGYFASYSTNFVPPKQQSISAWQKKRTASLTAPTSIEITLYDTLVEMLATDQASVSFKQVYKSDRLQDAVIKTLKMQREGSTWKITAENVIQTLPTVE